MKKLKFLNEQEELELITKVGQIKRKDIISEYGISERHYKDVLLKYNIQLREKAVKYNFNEDYFESIDTEDKAYFLGFIVADGCLNKSNATTINITQKETDILEDFKKYTEFEGKIFNSKKRNINSINLNSKKMFSDLNKIGITPTKTMFIKYPNIPLHLENHFMRGLFDGDGCISIHKGKRENSERGQVNICSGSKDFIETYVDKLIEYAGVKRNNIRCPKGTYYVIDWGGLSDVENIYHFLYKDATIYLERKKQTFDKVMNINLSKIKYRKKHN